jgi:hypothetical protein
MTMHHSHKHTAARLLTLLAAIVICSLALTATAGAASEAKIKIRVEGAKKTHFNGKVATGGGTVPGGTNSANCPANTESNVFTKPNPLTALVAAVGSNGLTTSGKQYGWGIMLCSVKGETVSDSEFSRSGGWLVRINQKDSTLPAGFATATTDLKSGDSVLIFKSPGYGVLSSSLELTGPSKVKKGRKATFKVASYALANDVRTAGAGLKVKVGRYSGKTNSKGQVKIKLKKAGRFLARVSGPGAIRGTTWVTVKK